MDHQTVVTRNRTALEATIAFGLRKLDAPTWEPEPGSEGAVELAPAQRRADGSPWGDRPARTAYAAANLMMTGVLDDLGSLQQLLGDQMPVIGPTLMARSAVEIASGIFWLMEPGIGARRRVCRELVYSLTSARRAGQVAGEYQATGLPVSDAIREAAQQEASVLQRITDLAINPPAGRDPYSPSIENETAPSATRGTAAMLRLVMPPSVPPTAIYRTYSAVMHGEIYGLMNFMAPGVTTTGTPLLHWHLQPDVLNSTIQIAISAFGKSFQRIADVMGWGRLPADLWDQKLRNIYRGLRG
jgi:hypothetical protein